MNSIILLLPFLLQAQATEEKPQANTQEVSAEQDEAMNKLIDVLMDDDKNDDLVDMIAEKLVNKLIGFDAAVLPQRAQAFPAAEVRQFMQKPAFQYVGLQQAPQVNVGYDNSKNVKLGENREGVLLSRNKAYNAVTPSSSDRWGTGVIQGPGGSAIKGGQNPYGIEAKPVGDRPQGLADTSGIKRKSTYVPGPEYQNFGSADYEKLQGAKGFGAARDIDKGLDNLQGVNRKLDEKEDPQPDALTVLAVGLLSACVGSAATFALFHLGRRMAATKTGMKAPLLTY